MAATTRQGEEHPRDCPGCKSRVVFTYDDLVQDDVGWDYCVCPECGHHIVIATVELPPSWVRLLAKEVVH